MAALNQRALPVSPFGEPESPLQTRRSEAAAPLNSRISSVGPDEAGPEHTVTTAYIGKINRDGKLEVSTSLFVLCWLRAQPLSYFSSRALPAGPWTREPQGGRCGVEHAVGGYRPTDSGGAGQGPTSS